MLLKQSDSINTSISWIDKLSENLENDISQFSITKFSKGTAKENFIKLLFDLTLYHYPDLVNLSFEILSISHSKHRNIVEILNNIKIADDKRSVNSILQINTQISNLNKLFEESENWYGETNQLAESKRLHCIEILNKLISYLNPDQGDSFIKNTTRNEEYEPEIELMPLSTSEIDKRSSHKNNNKDSLEAFLPNNFEPNAESQQILRHVGTYEVLKELLMYELQTSSEGDSSRVMKDEILSEIIIFLVRFIYKNPTNQQLLLEDLPMFIKLFKANQNIGVELLLEQIYKDNRKLLFDDNHLKNLMKLLLDFLAKSQQKGKKVTRILTIFKSLMKNKIRIIKGNQTLVLNHLSRKEYAALTINCEDQQIVDNYCNLLIQFDAQISSSKDKIVTLHPELDYLESMLLMLAYACEEKNSVTETKCQKAFSTK